MKGNMKGNTRRSFKLSAAVILAGFALGLGMPAMALAQAGDPSSDPTAAQYQAPAGGGERPDTPGSSQETVTLTSSGGTGSASSGTLPFTGFDAAVVATVALLLGATGLALRRMSAVR